jgi:hypothetical protein
LRLFECAGERLPAAARPPGHPETARRRRSPARLDAACTENLSVTAALERLLALEVTDNEARRLAGRLRFASLPSPASLEDFDHDAAPGIDRGLIGGYLASHEPDPVEPTLSASEVA